MWILLERFYQFVECLGAVGSECRFVEVIVDALYEHRGCNGCQWELEGVFLAFTSYRNAYLFLVIEIPLAVSHRYVIHIGLDGHNERSISLDGHFLVGAVVAYNHDLSLWQFVTLFFIHPSLHGGHNFWIVETVDVVVASSILSVGRKIASIVRTFECHAEIVSLGIERIAGMFYLVSMVYGVYLGDIDVESTHAHMSIAAEI